MPKNKKIPTKPINPPAKKYITNIGIGRDFFGNRYDSEGDRIPNLITTHTEIKRVEKKTKKRKKK